MVPSNPKHSMSLISKEKWQNSERISTEKKSNILKKRMVQKSEAKIMRVLMVLAKVAY